MTVSELTRGMARVEHSLDALITQVAEMATTVTALRGDLGGTKAVLELREQHQMERTQRRDQQIAGITTRLDAQERAVSDLQRRWWTMTGRMAGVVAGMTILGSGAATAVARLTG